MSLSDILTSAAWPSSRLGDGLEALARQAGLTPQPGSVAAAALTPPATVVHGDRGEWERWMDWAARTLGIEAESVESTFADFEVFLRGAAPALLRFTRNGETGFALLLKARGKTLYLLGPDLRVHCCPAAVLREAVCSPHEAPLLGEIDSVLALAELPPAHQARARKALLRERLGTQVLGGFWILQLPPGAGFWRQLTRERLPHRVGWMLAVFGAVYGLEIMGWGLMGDAALNGRLDMGWMAAWVLMLISLVPLQWLAAWLNATFGLDAGRILKRRLLAGALRIDMDAVRHQGVGQLLSRVMESQALESLAVNGGLLVLVTMLELVFAAWVLWLGAGGALHVAILLAWTAIAVYLSVRYIRHMRQWTMTRLDMTHALIERMVGHRTRLAQEQPGRRDALEDQSVNAYMHASRGMDHAHVWVGAGIPGGWAVVGLLGLAPAFVAGGAGAGAMAIGFGGLLLAHRAFGGLSSGPSSLAAALIAWRQVAPMFCAASDGKPRGEERPAVEPYMTPAAAATGTLLEASHLTYAYTPRGERVIDGAGLTIQHGERLLLEGASGGGKSTLAALLSGLRTPDGGLLLLNGLDRHTLGERWQRLVAEAPQFHDNHILSGTLGFNLLMGREWPASDEALAAAETLCKELGLGELLARMPSGLQQMVGETGWQLSHGEKSRVYLARALLQGAPLTLLDESFAALDPETLKRCLECAFSHARTLMVIAHP